MSETPETIAAQARPIATLQGSDEIVSARLVADDGGHHHLLWSGPQSWVQRATELIAHAGGGGLPQVAHRLDGSTPPTLLLPCNSRDSALFDIWKWRNLPAHHCVRALAGLARTVGAIHDAGWTLDGIHRGELLFDASTSRLVVGTIPRLRPLDDEPETIWRDIRVFAALAYENFLELEYPGGHQLVSLLQDRTAMMETGITAPGLAQVLAGCVTPYGDLAYQSVDDLVVGLDHLAAELSRPRTLRVASRSTLGNYIFRQNNQDSCGHVVIDTTCGSRATQMGFFCVADGIGGIADGERASSLAVRTANAAFVRAWSHYDAENLRAYPSAFARAIAQVTSQRLALEGNFAPQANRGGTTFTGLFLAGDRGGLCHVGDSRAVLIRDGRLIALTRDHTLASILEDLGESDEEVNRDEANHRTIARFFSTGVELEEQRIDGLRQDTAQQLGLDDDQRSLGGFTVRRGDLFVLTSDGAHGEVSDAELIRLAALHGDDPGRLCEAIVDRALAKIGRDNATVVAVVIE